MRRTQLVKIFGIVTLLNFVGKVLGFIREASMAAVFGATSDVDAYLVAQSIPYMLFSTVNYALTTTFIPLYSHVRENEGKQAGARFTNTVLVAVVSLGLILVVFGEIWAEQIVAVVAPGFEGGITALTVRLSRILFPMMVFQVVSGIMAGVLQAEGRFTITIAAPLLQTIAVILSTVALGPRLGILPVALGALIGYALTVLVKVPALLDVGVHWRSGVDFTHPALRRMAVLTIPSILAAGATQLNTLVDRVLASTLPEGRVAALNYANKLVQLVPGIVGASVITVIYPALARSAARQDWARFGQRVVQALGYLQFTMLPVAVLTLVVCEPLVRIVYQRGAFDAEATTLTAWGLMFLSPAIALIPMRDLVSRAFFTRQDTRTPLYLGLITVGANIVLNIVLVRWLEHGGLALATVMANFIGLLLGLWLLYSRANIVLPWGAMVRSALELLVAGGSMGLTGWLAYRYLPLGVSDYALVNDLLGVVLVATVSGAVYVAVSALLRNQQLGDLYRMVSARVRNTLHTVRD